MTYIALTGRQPELSIAELESLYGATAVTRIGDHALVDASVDFRRLGGTIKLAELLTTLDTTNPQKAFDYCRRALPEYVADFPEGKLKLGVSLYGLSMPLGKQTANALTLKKALRQAGRSVRVVPNTEPTLSSAQTFHNHLTAPLGLELAIVGHGRHISIGRVIHVQNIDSYTLRDRGRPKRDAFVGMLPPKLAQMMINMAVDAQAQEYGVGSKEYGKVAIAEQRIATVEPPISARSESLTDSADVSDDSRSEARDSTGRHDDSGGVESGVTSKRSLTTTVRPRLSGVMGTVGANKNITLLDPFCGTGVILQEAALMDYCVYGTDLSEKMIDYSTANLTWADRTFHITTQSRLETADATDHTWRQPIDAVACETYLGQPFSAPPSPAKLTEVRGNCDHIIGKFLTNLAGQLAPGTPLCLAVPAWLDANGRLTHLSLISRLESFGYRRRTLTHVRADQLVYSRSDQVVARQLLLLEKI